MSTSSAAASPVRTSASPGPAQGSPGSGPDSGGSTRGSFAWFDRASLSWKTSQRCLVEGWARFSETWPRAGTMHSGTAYLLPPSAPLTGAIGCSSSRGAWATPTTRDHKDGASPGDVPVNGMLGRQVLWPTPDAGGFNASETPESFTARQERLRAKHRNGNGCGTPLAMAVRLWPTPTEGDSAASGNRNLPGSRAHAGTSLTDAANGGQGRARVSLNPAWVESLMGFPPGWTESGSPDTAGPQGRPSRKPGGKRRASPAVSPSESRDSARSGTPSSRKSRKRSGTL